MSKKNQGAREVKRSLAFITHLHEEADRIFDETWEAVKAASDAELDEIIKELNQVDQSRSRKSRFLGTVGGKAQYGKVIFCNPSGGIMSVKTFGKINGDIGIESGDEKPVRSKMPKPHSCTRLVQSLGVTWRKPSFRDDEERDRL